MDEEPHVPEKAVFDIRRVAHELGDSLSFGRGAEAGDLDAAALGVGKPETARAEVLPEDAITPILTPNANPSNTRPAG